MRDRCRWTACLSSCPPLGFPGYSRRLVPPGRYSQNGFVPDSRYGYQAGKTEDSAGRHTVGMASSPPARPRSRERYEERRQEVIDIAARVFAQRGYDATTIDDLVEATGLQRGGLYHYMGSKQDLLIAIHERFLHPLLAQARAIAAEELPPEQALRGLAHALMENIARYTDQVTVFFQEWRTIEGDPRW